MTWRTIAVVALAAWSATSIIVRGAPWEKAWLLVVTLSILFILLIGALLAWAG